MRLQRLPGWVVDNDVSVREEVLPYLHQSAAERWTATRRCCRAAMRLLAFRTDRDRVLAWRDPLPDSTVAALERLRRPHDG